MFKDLMINRDNIEQVIEEFCRNNYINYTIDKGKQGENKIRYNIDFDNNKMFLDVYYNNKGGTTLQTSNGKLIEEKTKLATFIVNNPLCKMSTNSSHNRDILFENITLDEFNEIIEIIKEEDDYDKELLNKEKEDKIIVKLQGRWSDKVTLIYTFRTKNVRIQGRPLILFNLCCSYFNELLDIENVIDCLQHNYTSNISKENINEQYLKYLPKSHDKHSEKLKKSLIKAVYNLNLKQQEYTCTELVFEVLRALEGHIKLTLLRDYNIKNKNRYGSLSMFKFNRDTGIVTLARKYIDIIDDAEKIAYYEHAYKHYVVYRHNLFHWDYPDDIENDNTEQLENIEDTKTIIMETLKIIDNYY